MTLLRADNLTVFKGNHVLFRRFCLSIQCGEIIHLSGENGSGKTTLLQTLAGIHPYQGGKISRHSPYLYLGHYPGVKATLTPRENLRFAARLYHQMRGQALESRIRDALDATGLSQQADQQTRTLSAGQQRRTQLARLWLDTPPLWLLDEPLTALDSNTGEKLLRHIAQHRQNHGAVIITSHQALPFQDMKVQTL